MSDSQKNVNIQPESAKMAIQAGTPKTVATYPSVANAIQAVARTIATTNYYQINSFYKPELLKRAYVTTHLDELKKDLSDLSQETLTEIDTVNRQILNNLDKLQAFYLANSYNYLEITDTPIANDTIQAETIKNKWLSKHTVALIVKQEPVGATETQQITHTGYTIINAEKIAKALDQAPRHRTTAITKSQAPNNKDEWAESTKAIMGLAEACGLELKEVQPNGDFYDSDFTFVMLETLVNSVLQDIAKAAKAQPIIESNKPYEQINMFSNIAMGVDTAEIVGRHQFFTGMHRGFSKIGEQGLYEAITKAEDRHERVIIPYETRGSSSVYTTKLATSVEIGNVTKPLISNETDAKRLSARLIKTQGILYLWAMHTNSLTIYNTKVADMLRLTGYKGRIKPEHYEDITEGIKGLFAIVIDKTADHYNDPVTGEYVKLGKNELYGALIRPIGELEVIWQLSNKVYEYTDTELENLSMEVKESLEAVGQGERVIEMIDEKPTKTIPVTKYYLILRTEKKTDKKGREIVTKVYEQQAVYIKKILRLKMADGMLNPTTRRATVISKPLLLLNTLQERQYIQLGDYISSLFDQYQTKTAQGLPIEIAIQTLLEYRGLADPDSLSRVKQTKTYLKQALDKLVTIGHIAKWTVRNGDYEKLTLAGKDLKAVILIYPTENVQKVYKSPIGDDDKELTAILTQEVRADGLTTTAERYGVNTEVIEAVINNRDTADSLPLKAYNELKAKAYDKAKAGNKQAKKTTRTKKVYGYKYRGK